jgi:hypothetical protein
LYIGFGDSLIGGARTDRSRSCLCADSAILALAVKEQPTSRQKDQRGDNENGKPHAPTPRGRISWLRLQTVVKTAIVTTGTSPAITTVVIRRQRSTTRGRGEGRRCYKLPVVVW